MPIAAKAKPTSSVVRHSAPQRPKRVGALELPVHVERRHEEQQAGDRRPDQPERAADDQQQHHEAQRIGDEHRVVVEPEAAAEREQQPHERHRERDQRPAEFIGVGLELVEQQLRVLALVSSTNPPSQPGASSVDLRDRAGPILPSWTRRIAVELRSQRRRVGRRSCRSAGLRGSASARSRLKLGDASPCARPFRSASSALAAVAGRWCRARRSGSPPRTSGTR